MIAGATAAAGSIRRRTRTTLLINVFPVARHAQQLFQRELKLLLLLFIIVLAYDPRVALHVFGAHEYGRLPVFLNFILRKALLHAFTYEVLGLGRQAIKYFPNQQ